MPSTALSRRLIASTTVLLVSLGGLAVAVPSASASRDPRVVAGWGYNNIGQTDAPESLQGKQVTAVAAGFLHSMALTSDGKVTVWGHEGYGQNDIPAELDQQTVTDIAVGWYSDLAITSDGGLIAWGNQEYGLSTVPDSLDGKTVIAADSGERNSMALTDDGKITAWGADYTGLNNIPPSLDDKFVTAIASGEHSNMALTDDGKVTVWVDPSYSSYGQADIPPSLDNEIVTAIDGGESASMALTDDGKVTVWGANYEGQQDLPAGLEDQTVTAISAGSAHMLALTSEGTVFAWGSNSVEATNVPSNLSNVTQISAGYYHSLAIGDLAKSDFTTGVTANIIGTPQVGSVLTASADDVDPGADSYTYRWFADDAEIDGATDDTFTPTAAQKDAAITVQVTAVKAGYNSSTDLSDPTDAVAAGTLDVTGSVTVSLVGSPKVGNTLSADSSVESTPEAALSGQWLRDGEVIADATGPAYDLTNADAGATITHEVTAVRAGYDDAKVTSNGIGPVDGGVITLPEPTVTGTTVVDGLLTASLPGTSLDPADAEVTYEWTRDGTYAGTGNTFTPNAGDAGEYLTVTATATKDYFDDATSDTDTEEVAPADFTTGPTATITGTLKVGETLTADEGDVAPSADSFEYQWYANDLVLPGADGSTLMLTSEHNHAAMSVKVTAIRAGYTSLSDISTLTSAVGNVSAPTIDLDVAKSALRRGQATRLTWSSDEATSLAASGGWGGARNESGAVTISPRALGGTSYILKATNDAGTTTAMVTVQVSRQAKPLTAWASNGLRLRGKKINVSARGLDARESYVIRVAGTKVATGKASGSGRLVRSVTIPSRTHVGNRGVTVTGSEADRTGRDAVRVVANKKLGLRLANQSIRASDDQRVTVTGLAAREKITLTYQGKRISPKGARANKHGSYTRVFDVDIYWGTKSVKASGQFSGRSATTTFQVVRRCYNGKTSCD